MTVPPDAYLIIIGAVKCGTSTLYDYLARHPAIAPCVQKEPEFFSSGGHGVDDVERYEELWEFRPDRHRYCLEASTGCTKFPDEPDVPERMRRYGIEPKLIYVVRDPVDRMESQFNHGHVWDRPWAVEDMLHPRLLAYSRYYLQMRKFRRTFPQEERYRILDFDRLVGSPQSVVDDLCRWLGLESMEIPRDVHANKTPDWSRFEEALRGYDTSTVRALVPGPVKRGLKRVLRRHMPLQRSMSEEERDRATEYLRGDIVLFGREYDFPVSKWGF